MRDETGSVAREHLAAARAARRRVDPATHAEEVGRLEAAVEALPEGPERRLLRWACIAEQLRDIGFYAPADEELRAAAATAREGLETLAGDHPDIAARLQLALGQVAARQRSSRWMESAERHLTAAARRFIDAGEREEAAAALSILAWSVQLTGGGLRAARESLTEALSISSDGSMRAGLLALRSQAHVWLGQIDAAQADIEIAWQLASEGDDRALAYVAWIAASIASLRGHREAVETWIRRGDERRGSFADGNVTGLWYDALVIDALARVGAVRNARDRLERVLAHAGSEPTAAALAEVSFEARWGDVTRAEAAWDVARQRPDVELWEAARLRLLLAGARQRAGEDPAGTAADAFELCASLEEPAVLLTSEPELARALLPLAASAGSAVAIRLLDARPSWTVRLLGGFAVHDAEGSPVSLTGQVRRLVAYLAVADGPVPRGALSVWLWRDAAGDNAPARLRQLLYRARKLAPGLVDESVDGVVRLASPVAVDLRKFTAAAARAVGAPDEILRVAAARDALRHLGGEVLPEEVLDAAWLDGVRTRLNADAAFVHGVLAGYEREEGNAHAALEHALAVLRFESTDEAACILAVELLRRSGRRRQAASLLADTLAATAALGLAPDPRLRALASSTGAP